MISQEIALIHNPDGKELVKHSCKKHGLHYSEFMELVAAVVEQSGKQRRKGLWDNFDDILDRIKLEE